MTLDAMQAAARVGATLPESAPEELRRAWLFADTARTYAEEALRTIQQGAAKLLADGHDRELSGVTAYIDALDCARSHATRAAQAANGATKAIAQAGAALVGSVAVKGEDDPAANLEGGEQ